MKLGTKDISIVYLGTNAVQKVYLGTNEVYSAFTGLLDDYPNAAAAYSLRRLKGSASKAIEVRNDSGVHLDIGFVDGELDTATLLTHCGSGNGTVSKWYDQSGNGRNATQTTAANQPQIVNSGSIYLENGKPVIRFNVANLASVDNRLKTAAFTLNQPTQIFYATKFTSLIGIPSSPRTLLDGLKADSALLREDGTKFQIYAGNYLYNNSVGRNTNNGLINVLFNGVLSNYRYNGNEIQSGSAGTTNMGGITIGGDATSIRTAPAATRELIVYASSQLVNQIGIETNINDFYSIY